MAISIKKKLRKASNRSFLAKDFEAFRSELINHARTFFPDKIQDFSEASVGGLLVDMAATVGDSLSYYLDHQFRELDPFKAVEPDNIRMHLKNSGVDMYGATPATVLLKFFFRIDAEKAAGGYRPNIKNLPVVLQGTTAKSADGITFTTVEDLDFAETDSIGNLVCDYVVKETTAAGIPTLYEVSKEVEANSGSQTSETFAISNSHVPFRQIILSNENISTILSVTDAEGNEYYEVASLSQDTVFNAVKNVQADDDLVRSNLEITPAPRRFVRTFDPTNKLTTLQFGAGDADTLDDDVLPDPSELALPLYGKTNFQRFSIDPNSLLRTHTLGIAPKNTTLTVTYRYGGGLTHNATSNSIVEIETLQLEFRKTTRPTSALTVRQTMGVVNPDSAVGGSLAPTLDELKQLIPIAKQSQSRVVTREDLLARIYTMPARFGRVYRASITPNPVNPLSALIYLASLDRDNNLTYAPDTLKKNLSNYLNEFRLISDAFDILDVQINNFGVRYSIIVAENVNKVQLLQQVNNRIADALQRKYFQIDQPLIVDDITNVIINTDYVISLIDLKVFPRTGTIDERSYSSSSFPFDRSTKNGIIFGPIGSIFELKFPADDIIGTAS